MCDEFIQMTNLSLMELQESLGRLFEAQFLFDIIKVRIHGGLNDDQTEELKNFCSAFCRDLALKWRRLGFVDSIFFKIHYNQWLRLKVQWPSFIVDLGARIAASRKKRSLPLAKLYKFVRRINMKNNETIESIGNRNELAVKMLIRRTKAEIKKKCPLQKGQQQWILV